MSQGNVVILQQMIQARGFTWKAGITSLSKLTPEQRARRLGLRLESSQLERVLFMMLEPPARVAHFPTAWDWRNADGVNWTTGVRDQEECGACVAFSAVAVMEVMLKRQQGDPSYQADLSEAHLFFCGCGDCCEQGWWPTYALDYAKENGVPDEACFPYEDQKRSCSSCADWQSRAVKVVGWQEIADVGTRKEWLATTGPLMAGLAIYEDLFHYVGGVYRHATGSLAGYHSVCVVGYSESEQAWICKNSWGPGWGESGWFKIGYGECGIDTQFAMYGIEAVAPAATPPAPTPEPPVPTPTPEPGCNPFGRALQLFRRRTA